MSYRPKEGETVLWTREFTRKNNEDRSEFPIKVRVLQVGDSGQNTIIEYLEFGWWSRDYQTECWWVRNTELLPYSPIWLK